MGTGTDAPYPLATGGFNATAVNSTAPYWTGLVAPSPTAAPPVPTSAMEPAPSGARVYESAARGRDGVKLEWVVVGLSGLIAVWRWY